MKQPKKMCKLDHTDRIVAWTMHGIDFGYPSCCIGEFVIRCIKNTYKDRETRQFDGTGFVPCIKCNELPEADILAFIEANRSVETSFQLEIDRVNKMKNKKAS